ncbi:MAG: JAB-like toxin 1 domain-containing protein [Bacteroidales bacterium]|nr:JAB-like toxin 1 domain-containing protein [Bacteroidales bacterium]
MAEQTSTGYFQNPYKFNGKSQRSEDPDASGELDEETGLYYYGARYYDPRGSLWLSVDPMMEKYAFQTPYCYVGNRPINVIDPFGEDEWEVGSSGRINWIKESKTHTLYKIDNKGKRTGESLTMNKRDLFDQLSAKSDGVSVAVGGKKSQKNMTEAFKFLADNTDVEWRMDRFREEDGIDGFSLGSNHSLGDGPGGSRTSPSAEDMGHSGESVIAFVHSHPGDYKDNADEISSMGWDLLPDGKTVQLMGDSYIKNNKSSNIRNSLYYTYFPKSGNLWMVRGAKEPAPIRNIRNNFKRFFFGTLNTM